MKDWRFSILLVIALLFSSCSVPSDTSENEKGFRSAEIGISSVHLIAKNFARPSGQQLRPAAPLGVFASSFLAQGAFIHVASALNGIQAHTKIIKGQNVPSASETFTLLTELASLLQVNIPDMLNRSTDRASTLNEYIASLRATGEVAMLKKKELEVREEQLQGTRRSQRTEVSEIERVSTAAFREEDYATATQNQEKLSSAKILLVETESQLNQTRDTIRRYEDILDIASKRLNGILKNREILIAGLRVTDVPGVQNLDILDNSKQYRRSGRGEEADVFGTEYIQ
jgi:hypothetical protein